jgi:hypothetical protein
VALLGLAWGLWLGLPGRESQSADDIEKAMESGGGTKRRRRKKRSLNPLAWIQRKAKAKPSQGRGFKLKSPDDR